MIAAPHQQGLARGSDRVIASVGVALVHIALGLALLFGLAVRISPPADMITRVIDINLPKVPPPIPPKPVARRRSSPSPAEARPRDVAGGSTGPSRHPLEAPAAPLLVSASTPAPGGDGGHGATAGSGNGGGGSGGNGAGAGGEGGGGTDLEQVAGSIDAADYPRAALKAGIGGRVAFVFTVGVSGRVTACTITRSSGNAELDAATCQVVRQRFRYRPSTDRAGRPVADEVDGEHVWSTDAHGRPN